MNGVLAWGQTDLRPQPPNRLRPVPRGLLGQSAQSASRPRSESPEHFCQAREYGEGGEVVGRKEGYRGKHGRDPRDAQLLGHEWSGEGERVGQKHVCSPRRLREVLVGLLQAREEELFHEVPGRSSGLHYPANRFSLMVIDVGADRSKPDPLSLDEGSVELGCRDRRVVPACFQAESETEIGVKVSKRAESRDHHALTHEPSHFARRPDYIAGGESEGADPTKRSRATAEFVSKPSHLRLENPRRKSIDAPLFLPVWGRNQTHGQ